MVAAELVDLLVYPVKSCAGMSVASWDLDDRGLCHDRSYMVVDAATRSFLTQRQLPALARVRPHLADDSLRISTPGGSVVVEAGSGPATRAQVWDYDGPVRDCGGQAAALLSDHLGRDVRLVALAEGHRRTADESFAGPGVPIGFSDGFPLLVVGQASLEALNQRLAHPLPMNRFRPNLAIGGTAAFAEDRWREISVGAVVVRIVKPCTRCRITTVDQDSGRFDGAEPLRTLGNFRRGRRGVLFGQNAVHATLGTLRIGDPVTVLSAP